MNNTVKQIHIEDILDLSSEQLQKAYAANILAMSWLTKAALPSIPAGASIINTTSIHAYQPSLGLLDYASTKAAIANFTHASGKQLINKGIRVNTIAPGPIWTPLQPSKGQPMEKLTSFGENTTIGRAG